MGGIMGGNLVDVQVPLIIHAAGFYRQAILRVLVTINIFQNGVL
jgi:hypothetical protein